MEASALPASVGLARPRLVFGASLLRIRSDDQLVSLFRAGSEDAFRVIHDRYRARLHAYTRQMLGGSSHDSEDALQEIFVRAYYGLRANHRELALRPWLYRVAHNRCVDELRRPPLMLVDPEASAPSAELDPAARVEQRDALRRLIADVQRLPDQQRSALLMRELSGMTYHEVATALSVSVPAVKSLLVRARVGLAQASEARDTACAQIREELIVAHDRGVRASGLVRRHVSECAGCRQFRAEIRGVSRQLAALAPTLGPIGILANLLGLGGGGGAAASGSAAAAGGVAGGAGAAASAGLLAGGASHVVTLLAAAVVTAGSAVEIQKTIIAPAPQHARHHAAALDAEAGANAPGPITALNAITGHSSTPGPSLAASAMVAAVTAAPTAPGSATGHGRPPAITQLLDPDQLLFSLPAAQGLASPSSPSSSAAGNPVSPTPAGTPAPGPPVPATDVPTTGTAPAAASPGSPGSAPASGSPAASTPGTTPTAGSNGSPSASPGSSSSSTPNSAGGATSSGSASPSSSPTAGSPSSPAGIGGSPATATPKTVAVHVGVNTPTRIGAGVAGTVSAGSTGRGRVITFVATRRHARHGFTLGTLLPR